MTYELAPFPRHEYETILAFVPLSDKATQKLRERLLAYSDTSYKRLASLLLHLFDVQRGLSSLTKRSWTVVEKKSWFAHFDAAIPCLGRASFYSHDPKLLQRSALLLKFLHVYRRIHPPLQFENTALTREVLELIEKTDKVGYKSLYSLFIYVRKKFGVVSFVATMDVGALIGQGSFKSAIYRAHMHFFSRACLFETMQERKIDAAFAVVLPDCADRVQRGFATFQEQIFLPCTLAKRALFVPPPLFTAALEGGELRYALPLYPMDLLMALPKYPLFKLLRCLADVCKAVDVVHQRGYLHSDIKLDNILVREVQGTLRGALFDWDLVKKEGLVVCLFYCPFYPSSVQMGYMTFEQDGYSLMLCLGQMVFGAETFDPFLKDRRLILTKAFDALIHNAVTQRAAFYIRKCILKDQQMALSLEQERPRPQTIEEFHAFRDRIWQKENLFTPSYLLSILGEMGG